jgi:hypothetical protein
MNRILHKRNAKVNQKILKSELVGKSKTKSKSKLGVSKSSKVVKTNRLKKKNAKLKKTNSNDYSTNTSHESSRDEDDLIKKIINYLLYITKNLDCLESEKECFLKVLDFLKEYRMNDPIAFLKVRKILT